MLLAGTGLRAATLTPVEFRQEVTFYNLQSERGVPISSTNNNPSGSDGRMPTGINDSGTANVPTPGQFKSFVAFGAIAGGTNAFSGTDLALSRAYSNSSVAMVLKRAQLGAPYLARMVSYAFGSIVEAPASDETGTMLNVVKETYWQPEPYSTNKHANSGYYYSPHAKKVFAIQAGPMKVTWRKMIPYTAATLPTSYVNQFGSQDFETNGTSIYLLYTVNHIISGSAAKPPKKMYWTEREFRQTGLPVTVPAGRVGAINFAYNNSFPRTVEEEYHGPGYTSPIEGTTNQALPELRTIWFDQGQGSVYAFNQEGRVFAELLGDASSDGLTREHLGWEIVDVLKQPAAAEITVELGERMVPPSPESADELFPEPIQTIEGIYVYRHTVAGSGRLNLYATRETVNPNDSLVHWLEAGVAGIKWPKSFARYRQVWPEDVGKYSHYLRPEASTEAEARQTAVQLATDNVPFIAYQDPLDQPRAKLTEEFKFFTFLDAAVPAHRTLLRFTAKESVAFERVYSWRDANIRSTNLVGSVATNLMAWNRTNAVFTWPSELSVPRVVYQTVYVGDRIQAPAQEIGSGGYLAGRINAAIGILYHPQAYVDPFAKGFEAANRGAIIPVNAVPGTNQLEVWWFRTNGASAGLNAGNKRLGFATIYWPSVLARYTIAWPPSPREIVLASKRGSGTLNTFEAQGRIYRQNDPSRPGYNPNEEHAIMSGGSAFATRDDLNITNTAGYSSHPFVLVDYIAGDGRPAMSAFQVLREKPSAGWVFDYIVPAGQILQPPPPLTFLAKPVEGSGDSAVNFNTEPSQGGDLPGGWSSSYSTSPNFGHYASFTWQDRHHDFWVYRGLHSGLPELRAGAYVAATHSFDAPTNAVAIVNQAFSYTVHASRQDENLALTISSGQPAWLSIQGLTLRGTPQTNHLTTNTLTLVVEDLYDHTKVTNTITLSIRSSGSVVAQGPITLDSTNSYTGSIVVFSNRPPFLALSPTPSNSFTMRFYYKTEASFDWPGTINPPAVGSIVPYLRPIESATGAFIGDPTLRDTEPLDIVYRPVWPVRDPKDASKPVPSLPFGATLTSAKFNLPGVRNMLTARVLYQQSLASNLTTQAASVVLHDPTREKISPLEPRGLASVPGGVLMDYYQGKYYFPNLPPHLAERLYFDPNRGAKGTLVLKGEYVAETLGESYILLNVLRGSDLAAAKGLCPAGDPGKASWDALVNALATEVETFYENPDQPGSFIPNPDLTASAGVGNLVEIHNDNSAVDSYALSATGPGSGYVTLIEGDGAAFTQPGDPVAMHIFKVDGTRLYTGEVKVLAAPNPLSEQVTFQHTADLAGRFEEFEYEWKIASPVDGMPPVSDAQMSAYLALDNGINIPFRTLGGAGIQALCDNYVVMRYRAKSASHPLYDQWSDWTAPKLAEGWIKRVLAGINPFNQRVNDLFNNRVNTDVSILTQAGKRWEGDVALNLESINNFGLIEIYETILRRGRMLSIESGYNYGPANDALLLAAGYLNDLYMMLGGEAWADAANPTIGIGTKHQTYGDIATALFAFKGQSASLLDEELALLRGRDDFLQPGVQIAPVYNRLVWNYTRGIDSGEVIYALNYNIQENPDDDPDGVINANDAAKMFPQGHGDAYGHYLTALKGYYLLLMNSCFDWVPRIEAVNVLGQPLSVDYLDERKFAAAAAAVARTSRQIFDLTWRKDYQPRRAGGWAHMGAARANPQRKYTAPGSFTNEVTRYWGMDHWASRGGQSAYLNWVVGNAILPDEDPNPQHEGIQKIDRTTVSELRELASAGESIQTAMDNAEGGLSPLGIPEGGIAFDINPSAVVGTENGTHFEQVYQRAKTALNNAVASFDDAKDVTRLMRSEQDSLADFQAQIATQEHAYRNSLIELYGTPYPEDIGPGKTYIQGYAGPDLLHYMYVDLPEMDWDGSGSDHENASFKLDIQTLPGDWLTNHYTDLNFIALHDGGAYTQGVHYIDYNLGPHGFFDKPSGWTGVRYSPGKIQQAISELVVAHTRLKSALSDAEGMKQDLDKSIRLFRADVQTHDALRNYQRDLLIAQQTLASVEHAFKLVDLITSHTKEQITMGFDKATDALPMSFIAGLAAGGDLTAPARAALKAAGTTVTTVLDWTKILQCIGVSAFGFANDTAARWIQFDSMAPLEWDKELRGAVAALGGSLSEVGSQLAVINEQLRAYEDAQRKYRALLAEGDRIQEERQIFRQRSAAVVQGYRTRDAAFRLFRNEKLERYKTLFDLAARYALLAANAYDYETGLLNTSAGRSFVGRIINARALGVVRNGEPQYAGSNNGDPGLSSALAEMKADWDVLRGRLGFNNPDAYGTTGSLRTEAYRILPGSEGDSNWKDMLQTARTKNLLEDPDVRRYCMQIDTANGLPVPGIILTFSTTIADGCNLFGRPLAAGDHAFTPSAFATKIFGLGTALEGYKGMENPSANTGAVSGSGGTSPSDPSMWYLDPQALSATPHIYLIPVGVDSMRSPPLGDASTIRSWTVEDLAIPMPFNIGESDFSTQQLWQSSDSLTEPLFAIRKHQAFRPVSTASLFSPNLYTGSGTLQRSQFTSNRLVGRSAWNSQWKLIIPGKNLLSDPNEGLDRFVQTVTDIKIHFITYSYSGN